ncbi:S1C family serine protease [Streptomyces sp. SM12]|uniref:S1C family serine protease n=1 Tax=Streptomyces sp. SM12 TaxID=1071602 RepID=UPI000CD5B817|nr:trypsin-like peptidase domain-containing protein [Streptomyces sp. SM12]
MTGSRRNTLATCAAALCAAALLSACSGGGGSRDGGIADAGHAGSAASLDETFQQVVGDVLPSVVQITTEQGLGSGVVYDSDGHIVTNAHVLGDSDHFEVLMANNRKPLAARLVADYPPQDLAVIRLEDAPDDLNPATFGKSSDVEVGQMVLAMGNPLGLDSSVTQGIVSAVGRSLSEGEGGATLSNLVQTSAPINPGNSGGALVNLGGEVIGIPTIGAMEPDGGGQAAGIGFAIPAATVTDLADQMIENGKVTDSGRAALGVTVRTVLGEGFRPAGAAVVDVADDGPAADAGLRAGDVIIAVAEEQVTDVVSLAEALASHQPGDTVEVTWERDDNEESAKVKLDEV